MNKPTYILTEGPLTVYFGTVTRTVDRTDPKFSKVIQMLKKDDPSTPEQILTFIDPSQALKKHTCGLFDICNGGIYVDGIRCPEFISKRALEIADLGLDPLPIVNFVKQMRLNPSQESVKDLYLFLEKNNHPITSDGCFIAYKSVTSDFKDHRTKTYSNKVGEYVFMNRENVNPNRDETCAEGLHVASLVYAKDFGSHDSKIVVVKVNPKDCVSVPTDYQHTKMRVCAYTVIDILDDKEKEINNPIFNKGDSVVEAQKPRVCCGGSCHKIDMTAIASETGGRKITNNNYLKQERDSKGRFIPKSII